MTHPQSSFDVPQLSALQFFSPDSPDYLFKLFREKDAEYAHAALHTWDNANDAEKSLFGMNEDELKAVLTGESKVEGLFGLRSLRMPNLLRIRFWTEYDRCKYRNRNLNDVIHYHMSIKSVYAGVAYGLTFKNRYLRDPRTLAWILCPVQTYRERIMETLTYSQDEVRKILDLPLYDENDKIQSPILNAKIKIWQTLHMSFHGVKQVQVTEGGKSQLPNPESMSPADSLEDLEDKIKRLEKQEAEKVMDPIVIVKNKDVK